MKPFIFRENNLLSYNEKITIEKLKNIVNFYKVENNILSINWGQKFIRSIDYLIITDDNLEIALEQYNYGIDKYYFLEWNFWNWKVEYRMATNLSLGGMR